MNWLVTLLFATKMSIFKFLRGKKLEIKLQVLLAIQQQQTSAISATGLFCWASQNIYPRPLKRANMLQQ